MVARYEFVYKDYEDGCIYAAEPKRCEHGRYVAHADYAALLHRAEAAEKRVAELESGLREIADNIAVGEAENKRLREALEQYADKMNWGYHEQTNNGRTVGRIESCCFIGSDIARAALNGGEND